MSKAAELAKFIGTDISISSGIITFANPPIGLPKLLSSQATTSGTSKDFTVPTGTKIIYVLTDSVSHSGSNSNFQIQLGTSGGIVSSGYTSTVAFTGGGSTEGGNVGTSTSSFLFYYSAASGDTASGIIMIVNQTGNVYSYSAECKSGNYVSNAAGKVDLGAAVTTVRVGTADDRTLDGGVVNVMCIQ
jgi:hypothetical protein